MRVFVSYSSKDHRKVETLVSKLKSKGVDVWIDESRLAGGDPLWETIEAAIDDNDYFLPVISDHSLLSEWFHKELRHAYRTNRKTVPLRISGEVNLEECPKWIAELRVPFLSELDQILKALEFHTYDNLLSAARVHFRKKRYEQAVEAYQDALVQAEKKGRDEVRDSVIYIELSRAQEKSDDIEGAYQSATKAIDLHESPQSFLQRARCARLAKDSEIAIENFRRCLELEPDNVVALNGLGMVLYESKNSTIQEIASLFRNGIQLCEGTEKECSNELKFKLNFHLGFVLEKLIEQEPNNRLDILSEMAQCFKICSELDPQNRKTRFLRGYTEHQRGNLSIAIENYRQSLEDKNGRPLFCLGYALFENDCWQDAIQIFVKGVNQFEVLNQPDSVVGCMVGIVRSYIKLNRITEAIRAGREAVKRAPDDIRALLVLAEAYSLHHNAEKAIPIAKKLALKAAEGKCVRALKLLSSIEGARTSEGKSFAKEAAKLQGDKGGFFKDWFGIRQTIEGEDGVPFETAEIIHSRRTKSVCHARGWLCGKKCCL